MKKVVVASLIGAMSYMIPTILFTMLKNWATKQQKIKLAREAAIFFTPPEDGKMKLWYSEAEGTYYVYGHSTEPEHLMRTRDHARVEHLPGDVVEIDLPHLTRKS